MSQKLATLCKHTERPEKARGKCGSCYNAEVKKKGPLKVVTPKLMAPTSIVDLEYISDALEIQTTSKEIQPIIDELSSQRQSGNKLLLAWYQSKLNEQLGGCAICNRQPEKKRKGGRRHAIDHDHKTGRLRGVLCHQCNVLLGCAKDDILILARAIAYLGRHKY